MLRGSKTDPQRPLPTDPLTTDSVRRRPTTLSHLIEDVTCEDGLRLLPRPTARSKALPDDAPICQDDRLGGLDVCLARSIVCHDPLVDLSREEAFEAPDDIAFGPAASSPSCDVVDGRLVESHADDDGSIEGGVGLSVATPIEAVPAGGHPGRGRDRTRAAELREGGFRTNPVGCPRR